MELTIKEFEERFGKIRNEDDRVAAIRYIEEYNNDDIGIDYDLIDGDVLSRLSECFNEGEEK